MASKIDWQTSQQFVMTCHVSRRGPVSIRNQFSGNGKGIPFSVGMAPFHNVECRSIHEQRAADRMTSFPGTESGTFDVYR